MENLLSSGNIDKKILFRLFLDSFLLLFSSYNGCLPHGEEGRRRSRYQLKQRSKANGIKKSRHYAVKQPQTSKVSPFHNTDDDCNQNNLHSSRPFKIEINIQYRLHYLDLKRSLSNISMTMTLICSRFGKQTIKTDLKLRY